jgi:murein DD-endopeptidase MepM/ murein hydrolase activator NlpD
LTRAVQRSGSPSRAGKTAKALVAVLALGAPVAPAVSASTGGSSPSSIAVVDSLYCKSACAGLDQAGPKSVVRVTGRGLENTDRVIFLGRAGTSDNVAARVSPRSVSRSWVDVVVPRNARTGPVAVVSDEDVLSQPTRRGLVISRAPATRSGVVSGSGVQAQLESHTIFMGGKQRARLNYMLTGGSAKQVRVDLIRVNDGALVTSWDQGTVSAGTPQAIQWSASAAPKEGRYQFEVYTGTAATPRSADTSARASQSASPSVADSFMYLEHMFPVRGRHSYGDGFGADRGSRRHMGVDVLAGCGVPLVAARGGKVVDSGYGGGAGNYVTIDGDGTRVDYVYYHLRESALVKRGDRVHTGQLIGFVGSTGSSTACHLHFELWNGPWFGGGYAFDPMPHLKYWDRFS